MQAMLHGFRRVDMLDRETGRPVKGYSCFISFTSEGVQGVETAKQFISDDLASSCSWRPEVGKLLSLDFTPRGKVSSISTVREK